MSLLLTIIIVLVVLALIIWAIQTLPIIDGTVKALIMVITILIAAVVIAERAGLLSGL